MLIPKQRLSKFAGYAMVIAVTWSCAPQRPYRAPLPRSSAPAPSARVTPPPALPPAAPPVETGRKPLPQESKIREQDIRTAPTPAPASKDAKEPAKQASISEPRGSTEAAPTPTTPPLADDSSLLAKITPGIRRSAPRRSGSRRKGASCLMPGTWQRRSPDWKGPSPLTPRTPMVTSI